jgi:PAS domain S-box-containing protein/diguanylate cyclase (GGDEF)-like protein
MRRVGLLVLVAGLVGLASDGAGLAQFGQLLQTMVLPPVQQLSSWLIGPDASFTAITVLSGGARAAAAALLTVALGLACAHLSSWAGLIGLAAVITAWYTIALSTAIAPLLPPAPLLLAGLVAYGFGRLERALAGGKAGRDGDQTRRDDDALMPQLAASSCAAILTFDGDGIIRSCNRAAEAMFGYAGRELSGMPFRNLLAGEERDHLRLPVRREGTSCELLARRKNGQCFELGAALSTMELGEDRLRVAVLQDITELHTPREARALFDRVSGLPLEVLFADRIDQALFAADRAAEPVALLCIHLKLLRTIRATMGDAFADQLLAQAVARLRPGLRRSDTLARAGAAELGLLLPGSGDAQVAGHKAAWVVSELGRTFVVQGLEIGLEAHVGLATYPLEGRNSHDLQQRAEVAMLAARRALRPMTAYPDADALSFSEELVLLDELREAIETDQFFLEYLPKLDLPTDRLDGVEVLVRWQHPQRGVVTADKFISIAERHGLILPLTLRVITLAIGQLQAWQNAGVTLSVALNLSVDLLQDPQFPSVFGHVLASCGGRADQLLLEISERALAQDPTSILNTLRALQAQGCQISLDDFGTGSLSLPFLQKLPLVELKIDRSFVTAMTRNPDAAVVVRSAISLAATLGLRVVAVGVEDQETLDRLRDLGCAGVQGYFVGSPMTADKLEAWLAARLRSSADRESAEALSDITAMAPA